ncbi:MAG: cytochrome c553 [Akkermansiaceae bacterium]|jgi:cytochrome c553
MRPLSLLLILLTTIAPAVADDFANQIKPILEKHCIACHGPDKQKGGITLHDIDSLDAGFKKYHLLENVIDQVKHEEMPPDDEDVLPTDAERQTLITALSKVVDRVKSGDVPQRAGRVTLRRLNRNEYHYTVRDLFGVTFNPSKDFPIDGAGGEGFDNMADALFSTPTLLEKYLLAAKKVIANVYTDPALRNKVIFTSPKSPKEAKATAEKVLSYHATLAYRRRVSAEDLAPLLNAFAKGHQAGQDFGQALRAPLTALLINPRFLFRAEHDEPGKDEWPLNDFELATRLSYFLWSSMPDHELFQLADEGKLRNSEVLRAQTLRMIADPKFTNFARHFAGRWLEFEKMIDQADPDPKRFPTFTPELRRSMYYESVAFFSHLIRQNRPLTELIDSDYTFANATLAKHYGLSETVTGSKLRKVSLKNKNRGGILGMGSTLTTTSLPLRTSPVHRGVWILDAMLGDPAPPPPPDAGELPADDTKAKGLTFRQQLDLHRKATKCASCHARIDPLGFGLENFDAIGRWRTQDANGKPIDSSATLPGDINFSTPQELKALLLAGKDKFAANMTRKLISYATGRALEYYDEVTINQIVAELPKNKYATRELILQIINSRPFLNRSATR